MPRSLRFVLTAAAALAVAVASVGFGSVHSTHAPMPNDTRPTSPDTTSPDTTAPSVRAATPIVTTEDVGASVDFYRDVLGFRLAMTVPNEAPYDWAMLAGDDEAVVQLQSSASVAEEFPEIAGREAGSVMIYLKVGDVRRLRERVEGNAPVVKDLHETFYGTREFAAEDPNGVVLVFAEDLDS